MITTSVVNVFLAFVFMVVTGLEFNSLAVVGFVLVAAISLISGIIYNSKLKDEAYKGRSLKKANSEASRKSTLPIVDLHIAGLVIGLLVYLLGGTALHTFASLFVLGTLASFLTSTLGLKGMMWLVTNTTAFTGKYDLFAIDGDKVPNHMAEEKQSYFGAYADKDLTKNKKVVGIIGAVAFVAAFVGIAVSGALNHGPIFNPAKEKTLGSEIYLVNTVKKLDDETTSPATRDVIDELLANLKTYTSAEDVPTFDPEDKHPTLASLAKEIKEFTVTEAKTVEGSTTTYLHTYYQIKLKSAIDGNTTYLKDKAGVLDNGTTINEAFDEYFELSGLFSGSVDNSLSLKYVSSHTNVASPDWSKAALSTFIAVLVLTLYMMLRYRLSRGLASILYPVASSAITLGIFVLLSVTGLALPASIVVVVPVVALFSYTFMILIANKERDLILDERTRDNSYEHRKELSVKALGMAFTSILAVSVIGVYLFINFFGFGPAVNSYAYLAGIFGILIALGLIVITYIPCSNLLFKWFSNVNINTRPRKVKKGKVNKIKKDSAEPEEAIFIGIND